MAKPLPPLRLKDQWDLVNTRLLDLEQRLKRIETLLAKVELRLGEIYVFLAPSDKIGATAGLRDSGPDF